LFVPLPPPPRSTLFPYTTLFRSEDFGAQGLKHVGANGGVEFAAQAGREGDGRGVAAGVGIEIGEGGGEGADATAELDIGGGELLDRKSTRLNSSHSQISYAVFCL